MEKLEHGKLRNLLANPWVGAISIPLAVISIVLALYFGWKSVEKRELVLTQGKSSVLVFDPGVTKAFDLAPKVLLWSRPDTDPLKQAVYVVSFAIWNAGPVSIKPEHILKTLRIQIGDDARQPIAIWEVRPLAWSREEIQMEINGNIIEEKGLPQIPINFRILELKDGASFHIIYSGPEQIDVSLRGTVEGIAANAFFPKRKIRWEFIALLVFFIAEFAVLWFLMRKDVRRPLTFTIIIIAIVISLILIFFLTEERTELVEIPEFNYKPSIIDVRG